MDELDKILSNSLSEFEEEPSEGHFERFSMKLAQREREKKWSFNLSFLRVASVLVIILLSANLLAYLRVQRTENQLTSIKNNEIREAGFYYTNCINNGISDLEKMAKEGIGNPKDILQIKKELSEMDSLFQKLRKDYQSNPNDERVLNAMIEYYQTKLGIINTIKSDLENVKQRKNKFNENTEI